MRRLKNKCEAKARLRVYLLRDHEWIKVGVFSPEVAFAKHWIIAQWKAFK